MTSDRLKERKTNNKKKKSMHNPYKYTMLDNFLIVNYSFYDVYNKKIYKLVNSTKIFTS